MHYEGTTQEVIRRLKVHFVAAHYTDVNLILAVKGKRKIISNHSQATFFIFKEWGERKSQLKISLSTSMQDRKVQHFTRAFGTEEV